VFARLGGIRLHSVYSIALVILGGAIALVGLGVSFAVLAVAAVDPHTEFVDAATRPTGLQGAWVAHVASFAEASESALVAMAVICCCQRNRSKPVSQLG
jgi:hypothetical protein